MCDYKEFGLQKIIDHCCVSHIDIEIMKYILLDWYCGFNKFGQSDLNIEELLIKDDVHQTQIPDTSSLKVIGTIKVRKVCCLMTM